MSEQETKYLWGLLKVEVVSRNTTTEMGIYKVLENVVFENPVKQFSWTSYWKNQIVVKPIDAEKDEYKKKEVKVNAKRSIYKNKRTQ